MIINNEIINAVIHCKYKTYLKKNQSILLPKTDFEVVFEKLKQKSTIEAQLSEDTCSQHINYTENSR